MDLILYQRNCHIIRSLRLVTVADVHTMGRPTNECNLPNIIISMHDHLVVPFTFTIFVITFGFHP